MMAELPKSALQPSTVSYNATMTLGCIKTGWSLDASLVSE